jgi:anaerobic ribonucleoside-triphosphate reductase activating protein
MLWLASYDVVFQEVPGEVTLALNLAGCPNRCVGCHSPHLQQDEGTPLTDQLFQDLIMKYNGAVTCVCFMGGDADPQRVAELAVRAKLLLSKLKTAWYSGKENLPANGLVAGKFDYIKLGAYLQSLGGLDSLMTNQRFYAISPSGEWIDQTALFRK